MQFQLKHLILWSRIAGHAPRIVDFRPGRLNVITGASKTGKSAVIPIVDYCLGSDRCAIPVQTIRNACAWFGIVVVTSSGELLLARREPEGQQSTGDMHMSEGLTVAIPKNVPPKNTNVDAVKRYLDRLAGLSNLAFDTSETSGFKGRPSFRDLLAFSLQPQNIVANPDVLFFKADTIEHKEKLRTIFPYVLGAITPELLAKRWEADQLFRELRRKERELQVEQQTSERWLAELSNWAREARDLGLISPADAASARSQPELITLLGRIVGTTSADSAMTDAAIEAAGQELADLEGEEGEVTLLLSETKARMDNMTKLRAAVSDYSSALGKQRERLDLARWLRDLSTTTETKHCPICGGPFDEAHDELNVLCDALAGIEDTARQIAPIPAVFDKELVQVREEARRLVDRLSATRARRTAIEERSKRVKEERWRRASIDRFLGRAEQALQSHKHAQESPLIGEVAELKRRLDELRREISEPAIRAKLDGALKRLSGTMARILPGLDAERPNDPAELVVDELTIRVIGTGGRSDFLWELGSGANWLSYHVAALLSLHVLFLEQKQNPVPSFLIFDQPSQVYFPRRLAGEEPASLDPHLRDEDVAAVSKVFVALGHAATQQKGTIQIIVLDHAGAEVWGDAPSVHLVEEWRGSALVPYEWLTDDAGRNP